MKKKRPIIVFGEALFDCFPGGEQVLGGAPFNVVWHLQAFGDAPLFISRVGDDLLGKKILTAMDSWEMETQGIQIDRQHSTGQVEVTIKENEPHYAITPNSAYDFISQNLLQKQPDKAILYHGTLGLRNNESRNCLSHIAQQPQISVFLDVNLRSPWWQKNEVMEWIEQARWVKMNEEELRQLGFFSKDIVTAMQQLHDQFKLDLLIVTQGEKGAIVLEREGKKYQGVPEKKEHIVDTVGAGDGFGAVFIHGLNAGWPTIKTLTVALQFASKIVGIRGATTTDSSFYSEFR